MGEQAGAVARADRQQGQHSDGYLQQGGETKQAAEAPQRSRRAGVGESTRQQEQDEGPRLLWQRRFDLQGRPPESQPQVRAAQRPRREQVPQLVHNEAGDAATDNDGSEPGEGHDFGHDGFLDPLVNVERARYEHRSGAVAQLGER